MDVSLFFCFIADFGLSLVRILIRKHVQFFELFWLSFGQ